METIVHILAKVHLVLLSQIIATIRIELRSILLLGYPGMHWKYRFSGPVLAS